MIHIGIDLDARHWARQWSPSGESVGCWDSPGPPNGGNGSYLMNRNCW